MKQIIILAVLIPVIFRCYAGNKTQVPSVAGQSVIQSAAGVLQRVLGQQAKTIKLEEIVGNIENDVYEYECHNGQLKVRGSCATALTRGVYDYLKSQHLGMLDWSGPQFIFPKQWPDCPKTRVVTPFQIRHAFNVVTSGYTTSYWTWERWEQELDWQAMHGFNMLMASVAAEAIAR